MDCTRKLTLDIVGVRSIEHASYIDDAGIDACLRHGTWIVPTFTIGEHFSEKSSPDGPQDRFLEIHNRTKERFYNSIRKAVRLGVKVALGSDYCGWEPSSITAREFRYLVELGGMTPIQAICAGTSSAADLLGISNIGRIQVNSCADIVVVGGDPLNDIALLETSVNLVMKNGLIV